MEISEVNPDGNVYQLKDATARTQIAELAAKGNYTTTEIDTGRKWIDGRTIYRKSGYHAGSVGLTAVVFDASLTTTVIDAIIAEYGCAMSETGNLTPLGGMAVQTSRVVLQIRADGLTALSTEASFTKWYWTVEYIKKA